MKNNKKKQIGAWIAIIVLLLAACMPMFFAFGKGENAGNYFRAAIGVAIIVPVLAYAMWMVYRILDRDKKKERNSVVENIIFDVVEDGDQREILDMQVIFFDILSTKEKQFGFSAEFADGMNLCCLGDEPYNDVCEIYAQNADYLLSEAFCLYGDRDIFKPYEKHHSTVKEACELAEQLQVKNLILYHTEDKHIDKRKELYTDEGKQYYYGNLYVPDDLDVINLK